MKSFCYFFWDFFKINWKAVMVYDSDFIFGILSLVFKNVINMLIFTVPFTFIDNINGWEFPQLLFIYGFSYCSYAIWHSFFINTISIPFYIQSGEMDRILLRPVNPIVYILLDGFDDDGWGDLFFGIGILIYAIIKLKITSIFLLFLPLLAITASLIYAGISLLASIIAFFTVGNADFTDITMEFQTFSKYPIDIYNTFFKVIFSLILPIGFAAFFPSLFFLTSNENTLHWVLISPIVGIVFFVIACSIWTRCLKFYKSSGH